MQLQAFKLTATIHTECRPKLITTVAVISDNENPCHIIVMALSKKKIQFFISVTYKILI